jgi:hypothetical protein
VSQTKSESNLGDGKEGAQNTMLSSKCRSKGKGEDVRLPISKL